MPVMTSSLVCASRVTLNVGSSSAILCRLWRSSARRRGPSARRPGRTSASGTSAPAASARRCWRRPCRRCAGPRPWPRRRCRRRWPRAPAGLRLALHHQQAATMRRRLAGADVEQRLVAASSLPGQTRMKLRLPTNLSLTRLEDLADELARSRRPRRPRGSCRRCARAGVAEPDLGVPRRRAVLGQRVEQLGDADVLLGRGAEDRDDGPGGQRLGQRRRPARRRRRSPSLRYFSISASSPSTMASMSCDAAASRSTGQPAGGCRGRVRAR